MSAVNILLFVLILLRVWIGVTLAISARKNRLPNLYWLAGYFVSFVLFAPFATTVGNPLGDLPGKLSLWMFVGLSTVLAWVLVPFIHLTFYSDKKSPRAWILGAYGVLAVLGILGVVVSKSNSDQSPWVTASYLINVVVWGWHGWASLKAYLGVAPERTVEDWVKARYGMMVAFSVIFVLAPLASMVRVLVAGGSNVNAIGNAMGLVTAICQILGVCLQYLAWVMPERFRRWLNRNYKPAAAPTGPEMSEEELMQSLMGDNA